MMIDIQLLVGRNKCNYRAKFDTKGNLVKHFILIFRILKTCVSYLLPLNLLIQMNWHAVCI